MRKTASLFLASVPAAAAVEWSEHKGFNCGHGYGAEEIDTVPMSLFFADCQAKCVETPGCTAVTVEEKTGNCWRRKNLQLAQCQTGTNYDTWIQTPTPPSPASGFATTHPEFIKAFIEGILSDNGTDVKKCEGDAGGFALALANLVQTSVGAEKAVAAALKEAMQKCTVVEGEAEKLAFSALQDVLHPQHIAQNFAATRKDVLEDFGQALEMMAKKDFRSAGDKVGMAARRIVEGAQESNSLSSAYTKMGETKPAVQMTSTSSVVASLAVFAVTHWGAATMSRSDMPSATAADMGDFLEGVLEGLMSDGSDLGDCEAKISAVREALDAAKEHVGKAFVAAMAAGKVAKQSCGVVAKEAETLALATFSDIKHPDQVVQHFKDTQFDVLMEVGKAFEALAGKDYTTAGTNMGMAMRRAFEGKQAEPPASTPAPTAPPAPAPKGCAVSVRQDCGHDGITQAQCEAKGCCWGPGNGPWCFFSNAHLTTSNATKTIIV